ncbi:tRNA pseudouridine32 synthase / 23S rRNA pseudouridine746 synthase [Sphingomonas guangdongensis]|uniref:tRNA pseudouridine32 synthase / 23S rRNA pseudouridine746 synthase n=1 Tax=Sphingomonas guangdongensis TaxID=1141890 RepID=A0A285R519_9SPHN|nr:RluA family pseudouridine synthase [Sphingomonas guangdongensis]SOB87447.1 tRNA pseudouridine32 synthase / 23S rRNA pseudouridine746 synthase [Sphingomonas guangdongensis]
MIADRVIFLDGEAIVLDKPAGLPVDAPRDRSPSVESMLEEITFGFHRLPQPVHRIDRDTSGCLLLARNAGAAKRFGQAFEGALVRKRYLAVVAGVPEGDAGTIDLPLAKVSTREAGWRIVPSPQGKVARTAWRTLSVVDGRALVEFVPATGRTHQLRVHAASGLGLPIVGDRVYGTPGEHMMLHAAAIALPRANKPEVAAKAALPPHFAALGFAA